MGFPQPNRVRTIKSVINILQGGLDPERGRLHLPGHAPQLLAQLALTTGSVEHIRTTVGKCGPYIAALFWRLFGQAALSRHAPPAPRHTHTQTRTPLEGETPACPGTHPHTHTRTHTSDEVRVRRGWGGGARAWRLLGRLGLARRIIELVNATALVATTSGQGGQGSDYQ